MEEKQEQGAVPRVFRLTMDCPTIVDPSHKYVKDEIVATEQVSQATDARGRKTTVEKVVLTRTTKEKEETVGKFYINRVSFAFTSERRPTSGRMLHSCNVELRCAHTERTRGEALTTLVNELRGQRANEEILALMESRQLNRYNQAVADLPPIKEGARFRDKVEVYHLKTLQLGRRDLSNAIARQFPIGIFLRMQSASGDLTFERGSAFRMQGLALKAVSGKSGTYTKPTRMLIGCYPRFARDGSDTVVGIERPGWVVVLDHEGYNTLNALFHWSEQHARTFVESVANVTDIDPAADESERQRRRSERKERERERERQEQKRAEQKNGASEASSAASATASSDDPPATTADPPAGETAGS